MIGTLLAPFDWPHWDKARGLLAVSARKSDKDTSLAEIVEALGDYRKAQLWTGGEAELVGVTQLYPGQCYIWQLAGDFPKWGGPMLAEVEKWARAEGCTEIEFTGRRGWLGKLDWHVRKMNRDGVTMWKAL